MNKFILGVFGILLTASVIADNIDRGIATSTADILSTDSSSQIVIAYFGRKKKSCIKGFGICKLFPKKRVNYSASQLSKMLSSPHENFYALFRVKGNELVIQFLEKIPHFEKDFVVDEAKPPFEPTYKNLLGYTFIKPLVGTYKADKGIGKFGGVRIKIKKGNKLN